jgi:Flp pilus assembly pilin Flp
LQLKWPSLPIAPKGGERLLLGRFTNVQTWWHAARKRLEAENGAVAMEYALLLILIALAIIAAAGLFGTALATKYTSACQSLSASGTC